jgi:hypothetical protein
MVDIAKAAAREIAAQRRRARVFGMVKIKDDISWRARHGMLVNCLGNSHGG